MFDINYYEEYNLFTDEKNLKISEVHDGYLNGFHIKNKEVVSKGSIITFGGSKGAELALLLSEYYKEIDNLILIAPSAYRFQGLDFYNRRSSWTFNNIDLPYISFNMVSSLEQIKVHFEYIFGLPKKFRSYYESALKKAKNKEEARMKVENFHGWRQ